MEIKQKYYIPERLRARGTFRVTKSGEKFFIKPDDVVIKCAKCEKQIEPGDTIFITVTLPVAYCKDCVAQNNVHLFFFRDMPLEIIFEKCTLINQSEVKP